MKTCVKCGEEKDLSHFSGISPRCNECMAQIREITAKAARVFFKNPAELLLAKRLGAEKAIEHLTYAGYSQEVVERRLNTSYEVWRRKGVPGRIVKEISLMLKETLLVKHIRPDLVKPKRNPTTTRNRLIKRSNVVLANMLVDLKLTQREFARLIEEHMNLRLNKSAVHSWLNTKVPKRFVPAICTVTEGYITPHKLRPDLYDKNGKEIASEPKFPWLVQLASLYGVGYNPLSMLTGIPYQTLYTFNRHRYVPLHYVDKIDPYVPKEGQLRDEWESLKVVAKRKSEGLLFKKC